MLHAALAASPTEVPGLAPIIVDGDPNGLAYDPHTRALFIADCRGGAVLRSEGGRARQVAAIALGGAETRLGGLALTPYGTLYVTRLGAGYNAVLRVEPDGASEALGKPSQKLWRVGITYDASEHALYAALYRKSAAGCGQGAIERIDLASGRAAILLEGFGKLTGIAKLGPALVVADPGAEVVCRVDLVGARAVHRSVLAAGIGRPDSVCACGTDSVLVTSYDAASGEGAVHRLWLDGTQRVIARGAWEPRGVATDGTHAYVSHRRSAQVLVFRLTSVAQARVDAAL